MLIVCSLNHFSGTWGYWARYKECINLSFEVTDDVYSSVNATKYKKNVS